MKLPSWPSGWWFPWKDAAPIDTPWWVYALFPVTCWTCRERVRSFDQQSDHLFRHSREREVAWLERIRAIDPTADVDRMIRQRDSRAADSRARINRLRDSW